MVYCLTVLGVLFSFVFLHERKSVTKVKRSNNDLIVLDCDYQEKYKYIQIQSGDKIY